MNTETKLQNKPVIPPDMPVQVTMTIAGLQTVLQGLGYMQYNAVASLIHDLQLQGDTACMEYIRKANTPDVVKDTGPSDPPAAT